MDDALIWSSFLIRLFCVCVGGGGGGLNLLQEVFKQGFWKIFVMRYLVDFMFVPRPEVSLVPRVTL